MELYNDPTISFHFNEIPSYLRTSYLYHRFAECYNNSYNGTFNVPINAFKTNPQVCGFCYNLFDEVTLVTDLINLLDTIKYWMLDEIPFELYHFVFHNKKIVRNNYQIIKDSFGHLIVAKEIELIISGSFHDIIMYATYYDYKSLLKYLKQNNEMDLTDLTDLTDLANKFTKSNII